MTFHVVHWHDWHIPCCRKRTRDIHTDPERRFEPGAVRDRNHVYIWTFVVRQELNQLRPELGFPLQNILK